MPCSPPVIIPDGFKGYPVESFCISDHYRSDLESILIPGGVINDRIERLACDIGLDYGHEPFTVLCVLKGGYQFFSLLIEKIRQFFMYSNMGKKRNGIGSQLITAEFIRVKSYEDDQSTGKVQIMGMENLKSLEGANVLVVEDIIDTGRTIEKLVTTLHSYRVKSCRVSALFYKRNAFEKSMPDYTGFEVPDKFLIGCNLDYNERFRGLNHVCVINEAAKHKYAKKTVVNGNVSTQ